jgi:hypothetical protein
MNEKLKKNSELRCSGYVGPFSREETVSYVQGNAILL